jgi:calcineurin-like phosphoesterase family protein
MARRVWITADTHFGETEALSMFGRPFADTRAMDEALLDGINRCVAKRDVLLHLGDFCGPHAEGRKAQCCIDICIM